jgi:DNA-binding CsgD family transcriptional regulator
MKILLNETESQKWLHLMACEKTLEETSRLPKDVQLPNGMLKVANWPSHHKAEIMAMVADGKFPREIARELGMKESSVKHLVYTERKLARLSKAAISQDMQTIAANEPESPADELTTTQERIDGIIVRGASRGEKYSHIAAKIGRVVGGNWTSDDVSKRLKEMKA